MDKASEEHRAASGSEQAELMRRASEAVTVAKQANTRAGLALVIAAISMMVARGAGSGSYRHSLVKSAGSAQMLCGFFNCAGMFKGGCKIPNVHFGPGLAVVGVDFLGHLLDMGRRLRFLRKIWPAGASTGEGQSSTRVWKRSSLVRPSA